MESKASEAGKTEKSLAHRRLSFLKHTEKDVLPSDYKPTCEH